VIEFKGVKVPVLNVPLIEFETSAGKLVDLYNECQLEAVVLRGEEMDFTFVSITTDTPIVVRFERVRNLRIVQPEGWMPQEASQIDHLLIRPEGPWRGVVFKAGGLEYEFDCTALALTSS